MREHIRTWTDPDRQGFRLELFDTGKQDSYGKQTLTYEFYDQTSYPIFEGANFHCSPLHGIDSDATVGALLGFLSLRPGDTDREYFEDYTPEQMAWCLERAEQLSLYAALLEEAEEEKTTPPM